MNLYKSVENNALQDNEKTAIIYGDQRISYGGFLEHVNRIAAGLNALGLERGDRVALLMSNSADSVHCFYAAMKLGLVCVNLNIMFKEDEVNYILQDCEPKVMIANKPFLAFLNHIERYKNGSMKVISISNDDSAPEGTLDFSDFVKTPEQEIQTVDAGDDEIAVIGYTSGTTGFPKGAAHTHENVLAHLEGISSHLGYNSADVILAALPFFQLVAFITHACVAFHVGGTLVIHEKFDPVDFMQTIKKEKVTYFSAVPTIYQMLYSMSQKMDVDFSSVRFGICAGSPLSLSLREKFESTFKFRIIHCYGMTEIALIAACETLNAPTQGVSVGHVLPYIRVRLVKEDGTPCGIGEDGEIQIGAERSMKLYWNKPAETQAALAGGWFRTGDVGRFNDEGHLHIIDRKKDMIIRGGFNVYPVELERVLLQDPRIQEAVVIGIPHARLGEVPHAYIVPEKDAVISEDDVLEISRTKTANFKAIETVEIVDTAFFPRTALGKVKKADLRQNFN